MESNDNIDAVLSAAFEKAHAESPPAAEPPAPPPASEPPASEAPPAATPTPQEGRTRDEKGRFAPKQETAGAGDSEPERAVNPPPTGSEGANPSPPTTEQPAKPDPSLQALQSMGMTKGDIELFQALPEAQQKFMIRRYREMESVFKDWMPLRDYAPVQEMFKPYEAQLRMQGETPASIIGKWAAAEQALQSNAPATILKLCQMYGVDPATLAGKPQQAQAAPQNGAEASWLAGDPAYQQLQAELQRQRQIIEQQTLGHATAQLQSFAEAKGPDGKLLRPYFDKVLDKMTALASHQRAAGRNPDLEALYQEACWAHPEVREELVAAQRDAAAREFERKSREKAAAAGRAGISLGSGAPLPGTDRPAPQSLDKTVEEAWNRAHR